MSRSPVFAKAALGAVVFALLGCDAQLGGQGMGFAARYDAARGALESGDYTKAASKYEALLANAGPLSARLRLEYAHSLLRAGKHEAARAEAASVARATKGTARNAALAVQGTADHEHALSLLKSPATKAQGRAKLKSAQTALSTVLEEDPELDPVGGLASRLRAIEARLSG